MVDVGFANSTQIMMWSPYLILDLKTLNDSQDFLLSGTIFYNFALRFIKDSVPKKVERKFLFGRWKPLLS